MPRKSVNFERFSAFRRPDWRNQRVMQILSAINNPQRCATGDDNYVKNLRTFRMRHARSPDPAARKNLVGDFDMFNVAEATRIFDQRNDRVQGRRACIIECRILAGQKDDEIAETLGTSAATIENYEALFFNVRDRMKAHDWILSEVLVPAYDHAMQIGTTNAQDGPAVSLPYFDATLRSFAFFGGPLVLDFALSGFRRESRAQRREQTGVWYDENYINRLRQRSSAAAHGFQINKFNVMPLFETHVKLIEVIRAQDDEHKKQSAVAQAVTAMVETMRWAIGPPPEIAAGQIKARLEKKPFEAPTVELRDEELALLQSGQKLDHLDELQKMQMPAPRVRTEEPQSVDAK